MKTREKDRKPADEARKPYRSPQVIPRGDVRDVTLGPTPGVGESGNPGTLRP